MLLYHSGAIGEDRQKARLKTFTIYRLLIYLLFIMCWTWTPTPGRWCSPLCMRLIAINSTYGYPSFWCLSRQIIFPSAELLFNNNNNLQHLIYRLIVLNINGSLLKYSDYCYTIYHFLKRSSGEQNIMSLCTLISVFKNKIIKYY